MVTPVDPQLLSESEKFFPVHALKLMADRLGDNLTPVLEKAKKDAQEEEKATGEQVTDFSGNPLLCECELVSLAEIEEVARDPSTFSLKDIRLRTRLGMGTCQGAFCSVRTIGALCEHNIDLSYHPTAEIVRFMQERWKGLRPAMWGMQAREMELGRAIYADILNIDGAMHEQEN